MKKKKFPTEKETKIVLQTSLSFPSLQSLLQGFDSNDKENFEVSMKSFTNKSGFVLKFRKFAIKF